MKRRYFLQSALCAGVSALAAGRSSRGYAAPTAAVSPAYDLKRTVSARRFDSTHCYSHPRAGIIPGAGRKGAPAVVMLMNTVRLSGSDIFERNLMQRTDDLGETWTEPRDCESLAPRQEEIEGERRWIAGANFWPQWHQRSQTLLAIGLDVVYTPDWRIPSVRPQNATYTIFDQARGRWQPYRTLDVPDTSKFVRMAAGSTQRHDLADGTILLPFHYRTSPSIAGAAGRARVAVMQCSFDGQTLKHMNHGREIDIDDGTRGLFEPSLTRFDDVYYLTIRHNERAFVTRSRDGLDYETIRPWTFDDGADLGSYNTQAHWVTHRNGLFLVYTRRGANNDHVFRHRAPLFMAQVDPQRLCVLRASERILVPERGARLGNFGVTDVSPDETWVTVAEWMQPPTASQHGSDGSVFVVRIHWASGRAGD